MMRTYLNSKIDEKASGCATPGKLGGQDWQRKETLQGLDISPDKHT